MLISIRIDRKIVEHLMLVKAKEELSDVEEKNMLDYLYTSQYHMSGILAISLGNSHVCFPKFCLSSLNF